MTLNFAKDAKTIKNLLKVNDSDELRAYRRKLNQAEEENEELRRLLGLAPGERVGPGVVSPGMEDQQKDLKEELERQLAEQERIMSEIKESEELAKGGRLEAEERATRAKEELEKFRSDIESKEEERVSTHSAHPSPML